MKWDLPADYARSKPSIQNLAIGQQQQFISFTRIAMTEVIVMPDLNLYRSGVVSVIAGNVFIYRTATQGVAVKRKRSRSSQRSTAFADVVL
ncbi:hypothetical protein F4W66_25355 (plasmid) [Escherichia coli]|nr:hypothetical protein F4W66_25355 [Escherichia coli]